MEGVGARFGRSSTRYGTSSTTVFNGPVRKWRKKWVPVTPSPHNNASSNHHSIAPTHNGGISNGSNGSHLQLYKWTPITPSQNNNGNGNGYNSSPKDDVAATTAVEEAPRRKFKYVPIAMLEEQKNEAAKKVDDEAKPSDVDSNAAEPSSRNGGLEGKPDINDVPMEQNQASGDTPLTRQDLNESTLDLSLG
ncbi:Heat shock protein HSP 90-alpha like [Actinidia chinensis var. chinensis]|uniref:Heat shock protein HSP 90-alpha like n=1 Tax=Actinidia chinensis var. chinensis TaxID=1590841 RepID=A0A2R6RB57_ACTCC|nr:Heat shock protein HSP 90-alpha like [Actinidia chinensis var. chinensis]